MTATQIERLKRDSRELDNYIASLNKKGKTQKAHKLMAKREFLNQTILEVEPKFTQVQ
jgi:hypothetical protein